MESEAAEMKKRPRAKFYLKMRRKTRCAHHFMGTKRTWDDWTTVDIFDRSNEAVRKLKDTKIKRYQEYAVFYRGVKMVSKMDDPDRGEEAE